MTYHTESQLFPLQVGEVSALQAGKVMLQSGVGVGVAVGKLVYVIFSVKAEGKRHDVVASVVWAAVVVHIFRRKPLPATEKKHITKKRGQLMEGSSRTFHLDGPNCSR